MNLGPKLPNTVEKALPTSAEPCTSMSIRPVFRSTKPDVRMTSAVRVQTTMVSAKTSKMPHMPCCTGSLTLEDACTMTDEPRPASLENAPRLKPQVMARDTP